MPNQYTPINPDGTKTCTYCGLSKELIEFVHTKSLSGIKYRSPCKACKREEHRLRYLKNKEKITKNTTAWDKQNRAYRNAYRKFLRGHNPTFIPRKSKAKPTPIPDGRGRAPNLNRGKFNPIKDLIGTKRNKITVIECVISPRGDCNRGGRWKCQCDCGNSVIINGNRRLPQSCGCITRQLIAKGANTRRKPRLASINLQYTTHCNSAKSRGMIPLSRKNWENIISLPCHYCNQIDKRKWPISRAHGGINLSLSPDQIDAYTIDVNGIDRLNSELDYNLNNCVPCCRLCNTMKSNLSVPQFLDIINKIYTNSVKNNFTLDIKDLPIGPINITIHKQYQQHFFGSKKRSMLPLDLSSWWYIVQQPCKYCGGLDMKNALRLKCYEYKAKLLSEEDINKYDMNFNGIDRIDSLKGYEIDNCVPCCARCNRMKLDYNIDKFLDNVKLIYYKHISSLNINSY